MKLKTDGSVAMLSVPNNNFFTGVAHQLNCSVECAEHVEVKIQEELSKYRINVIKDHFKISGFEWLALIIPSDMAISTNDIFNGRKRYDVVEELAQQQFDQLINAATLGTIYLGAGSPEVALAHAMIAFRRVQLKLQGIEYGKEPI